MNSPPILISLKTGGGITTHKPRVYKPAQLTPATDTNTKKKFAFLSTETIPDYRSIDLDISEKSQKTSSNQSTKIHQLQQRFGHVTIQVRNLIVHSFALFYSMYYALVVCLLNCNIVGFSLRL